MALMHIRIGWLNLAGLSVLEIDRIERVREGESETQKEKDNGT